MNHHQALTLREESMNPHNELLPQTQEEGIVFWQEHVAEWERVLKEEESNPTMDEAAQLRAKHLYAIAKKRLEEAAQS